MGESSQRGASLMELLVVLVIVAILAVAAVTQLGRSREHLQRQNLAREFKVYLERARFDSVKRHANVCDEMSRVTILSSRSYSVTADFNQNGRLDLPGETRSIDFTGRSAVTILGSGVTLPATIRFDERGRAVLSDCVSTPPPNVPLVYICDQACTTATVTAQNANVLYISPAGTVSMLLGNATMPTFTAPTVTNVNSNLQVNPRLSVWDVTVPPTPTPTPTPTPAPVVTPTPRTCMGSPFERPEQTGCSCASPMWVRSNGLCK